MQPKLVLLSCQIELATALLRIYCSGVSERNFKQCTVRAFCRLASINESLLCKLLGRPV